MALLALNRKKQALAPDVRQLIISLTGFENEENIKECENYIFSNILYFQQPMIDGYNIQNSMDGLVEKFFFHRLPEKGKQLKDSFNDYINSSMFKDLAQKGVEWNIIQLLIKLAYRPTDLTSNNSLTALPKLQDSASENPEDDINWTAYLMEGWEDFKIPDDDEESDDNWILESEEDNKIQENNEDQLSDWSDEDMNGNPDHRTIQSHEIMLCGIPNPTTWNDRKLAVETEQEIQARILRDALESKSWLKAHVQIPWWSKNSYTEVGTYKLKSATFGLRWEQKQNTQKLLVISEYKILREILWMLQLPTNTHLFYRKGDNKFVPNPDVTTQSISKNTLHSILKEQCTYFDKVYELKMFKTDLRDANNPPPYTYVAFYENLCTELQKLIDVVKDLELKVDKQDETSTLITLMTNLEPILRKISFLHEIFRYCIIDWRNQPLWVCSARLLTLLYSVFPSTEDTYRVETSLNLFLASFSVYFNIIDVWLREGRLEDGRKEFFVYCDNEEFNVLPYEEEMVKMGVSPAPFLTKLVLLVRNAGKSMYHVIKLDKLSVLRKSAHNKGSLFKEYFDILNDELGALHSSIYFTSSNRSYLKVNTQLEEEIYNRNITNPDDCIDKYSSDSQSKLINVDTDKMDTHKIDTDKMMDESIQEAMEDPFLAEIFREYLEVDKKIIIKDEQKYESDHALSSTSLEVLKLLFVHPVLEKQLSTLLYKQYGRCAEIVMKSLLSEFHLIEHFIVLRKVLLMEAGNMIHNFYSFLFEEMKGNKWRNSVALTLQLVFCIEEEYPDLGANFSVILDDEDTNKCRTRITEINDITIGYITQWPICMIISPKAIARYNSIFKFLLSIKYAVWSLHNLRFSDLKETTKNQVQLKRLFVLKMWIQHCVTKIHFYFMGHVLHKYATELEETARQAIFIDDVINAHDKFLNSVEEHCLKKSQFILKKKIIEVLELCPMIESLWNLEMNGKLTEKDITELEDKYINTHLILYKILESIKEKAFKYWTLVI
uniref:Gamma-tubulin complex component n=1 Tax=Clastoptera arizonana TaxID=38151 RepID=A0A1B6DJI5_9HEMI